MKRINNPRAKPSELRDLWSRNKRGQIFTFDFIFATGIFLVILAGVIYLWDSTIYGIDSSEKNYEINWISETTAEQLVRIPGIPKDWWKNPENVTVLGLVDADGGYNRILDIDKLLQFSNITNKNYSIVRNKLLGTGKYNFYAEFSCLNDSNRDCFSGIYVDSLYNGNLTCSNGFNFSVINNRISSYLWKEAEGYDEQFGTSTIVDGTVSNSEYVKVGADDWMLYNISFPADGDYKLWARCSKTGAMSREINVEVENVFSFIVECTSNDWSWTSTSDAKEVKVGWHLVNLSKTSDWVNLDAILFTTDLSYNPDDKPDFGNFNIMQPISCITGNYSTENSILIVSDTKTATFSNNLDRTIRLKFVVWG